jgi:outer membrane protein TolC
LLFRDVILPQARQTVEASLSGYRAGAVDFLTLASNWRRMLQFELMLHENIADLHRGLASLEQALGGRVPAADPEGGQPQLHPGEGTSADQSLPAPGDSP